MNRHSRTVRLIGLDALERLSKKRVLIAGLGGVGAACALTLARCGIGHFTLVDDDNVTESNLNRQWVALVSTLGEAKVDVAARMIADIDPAIAIHPLKSRIVRHSADVFVGGHDMVIDAVDDITAKVALVVAAQNANIPCISCMGTGNRFDPTRFRITDIYLTHTDPLARVMRRICKFSGIRYLPVVWSDEKPIKVEVDANGAHSPASIAPVPPAAGLALAAYAINAMRGA